MANSSLNAGDTTQRFVATLRDAPAGFLTTPQGQRLMERLIKERQDGGVRLRKMQHFYENAKNRTEHRRRRFYLKTAVGQHKALEARHQAVQAALQQRVNKINALRRALVISLPKTQGAETRARKAQISKIDREAQTIYNLCKKGKLCVSRPDGAMEFVMGALGVRPKARVETLRDEIDRLIVDGTGGMQFDVTAPPGPGRLARVSFYPQQDAQSWAGATGLDDPGDCPVLRVQFAVAATNAGPFQMQTQVLDYATYRVLGIQTNYADVQRAAPAAGNVGPFAVTLSNLRVYNGEQLFITAEDEEMHADTFLMVPSLRTYLQDANRVIETPINYLKRRSRFFAGLRTYPIITDQARVFVTVNAFSSNSNALGTMNLPVTCNLIVDILQDKIMGDLVNPSPASRAGAVMMAGAVDVGASVQGKQQLQLVSAQKTR